MKINEIISEAGVAQKIGQGAGSVAQGVGKAAGIAAGGAGQFHSGFKAGQKKMDKILNPSKWFSNDKDTDNTAQQVAQSNPLHTRQALERAGSGRPLSQDQVSIIKSLRSQIESGERETQVDAGSLIQILKLLEKNSPINDQQRQLLMQVSKEF